MLNKLYTLFNVNIPLFSLTLQTSSSVLFSRINKLNQDNLCLNTSNIYCLSPDEELSHCCYIISPYAHAKLKGIVNL